LSPRDWHPTRYPDGVTSTPNRARGPLRVLLVTVWALVAVVAGVAILFGALTSALNGAGFETRYANSTPLFVLCLVLSLAAGACGILLGGRWWTALLVASPALIFGASFLFAGEWVATPLVASPLVVVVGVVCVLALPRRGVHDRRRTS
jgi:hypothetical protein